jgi:hypothetical protein
LRSARARRDERVVVAVSLDIDEPLMLLPLPVVPLPIVLLVVPLLVVGDDPVVPVAVPVEGVVPVPVAVLPVVPLPVEPAVGPEVVVLLLGVPEAPPWPVALVPEPPPWLLAPVPVPVPEPDWASTPPHASAAAAERARILKVCLMRYS